MRTASIFLLLCLLHLPSGAQDCAKSQDACSGGPRRSSPFLAASLSEVLPAPPVAGAKRASLREAARAAKAAAPADSPSPASPVAVSSAAGASEGAGARRAEPLSSPAWLLFIGAGLSALYFYLAGARRKGRRK